MLAFLKRIAEPRTCGNCRFALASDGEHKFCYGAPPSARSETVTREDGTQARQYYFDRPIVKQEWPGCALHKTAWKA